MGANCSELLFTDPQLTDEVASHLGPRCISTMIQLITGFIYGLILLFGLFGNLCTCVVVARNKAMKTATNYYLTSLALSDLITLISGLPFELHRVLTMEYPQLIPLGVCKIRGYISECTSYASILTITAFSVERWLAICFPLKFRLMSTLTRATRVIALTWSMAAICASPLIYYTTLNNAPVYPNFTNRYNVTIVLLNGMQFIPNTQYCSLDEQDHVAQWVIFNVSFWLFFVVPLTIIAVLYTHIAITLVKSNRTQRTMTSSTATTSTSGVKRKPVGQACQVMPMLIAVVLAFFICWLPFHMQRLFSIYMHVPITDTEQVVITALYYVSGYFYYTNAAVNPILYNVLNKRFRVAFLKLLCVFGNLRDRYNFSQDMYTATMHPPYSPGGQSLLSKAGKYSTAGVKLGTSGPSRIGFGRYGPTHTYGSMVDLQYFDTSGTRLMNTGSESPPFVVQRHVKDTKMSRAVSEDHIRGTRERPKLNQTVAKDMITYSNSFSCIEMTRMTDTDSTKLYGQPVVSSCNFLLVPTRV